MLEVLIKKFLVWFVVIDLGVDLFNVIGFDVNGLVIDMFIEFVEIDFMLKI